MMTKLLLILIVVGVWCGVWGEEIKIHTEKYENGKVKVKGNLVDGKQEGKWVIYDENGKMKKEENYVEGKQEGKEFWYYERWWWVYGVGVVKR